MIFSGRVHSVIFEDAAKSFYILKYILDEEGARKSKMVTIRGEVPGITVEDGTWFSFEGEWVTHPKYGRQLLINRAPIFDKNLDPKSAINLLVSNGVSRILCERVLNHFGPAGFLASISDSDKLIKAGLTSFEANYVSETWNSLCSYFSTLSFLNSLGVPSRRVKEVWAHFGDDAEKILAGNPWALVQIGGIDFRSLDQVAEKLGLDMTCQERVDGAVLYTIKESRGMGHLYTSTGTIKNFVSDLIPGVRSREIAKAIGGLHNAGFIVVDKATKPGTTAIYEQWFYEVESESAKMLQKRMKTTLSKEYKERIMAVAGKQPDFETAVRSVISSWSNLSNLTLTDDQAEGVYNGLLEPVSVLTGLPGTGKSTSLKVLVRILQDTGTPFLMIAPTGIAAKRLSAITGSPAHTIHKAFGAKLSGTGKERKASYEGVIGSASEDVRDGSGEEWAFSPAHPHSAQVVIIDEASMVDQNLVYRILYCTSPECRLVFVGDAAQLPSVGPGNVLRDLVRSGKFATVALKEIFRQGDMSDIIFAAHEIFKGRVPDTSSADFRLLEIHNDKKVLEAILKIAQRLYEEKANFQILSPRHAGDVGVTNLNARLRELINPKQPITKEVKIGSWVVREGDRIMVVRNNYDLEVYNGDIGKVASIDQRARQVKVKVYGTPIKYVFFTFSDVLKYLRLSYATTVHKSQGLEFDYIVMPVTMSFGRQLQRNLLYTGITRAKEKVFLVGSKRAVEKSIDNNREDLRNTLFVERLDL